MKQTSNFQLPTTNIQKVFERMRLGCWILSAVVGGGDAPSPRVAAAPTPRDGGVAATFLRRGAAATLAALNRCLPWAALFWVSSAFPANKPAHGAVLQTIIDSARPGDAVLISGPGVFHEHLVITNSIRFIGTNSPVIDGDGAGTPLILAAPGIEISGFVIRNSGRNLANFDCGILITAPRVSVRDCRIESDAFGVYVRGVNDCAVENNQISGDPKIPSAQRGNGIHLWKTRGDSVTGNEIHDKRDGIYLSYANDSLIAENRVRDTRFGIHYMYSNENRLLTNSLTGNVVGAALMFSRKLVVEGNVAIANRRHGIVLKQLDSSQIRNNVVAGQNRGFFAQQANQNRFEGNVIATNDIGLYLSSGSEQNVFVGNAFIRNTDQIWQPTFESKQGQKAPNAFSENGRGNYWSDYTGADRDNDGIGDTPYHETDVFGYIVDRHPAARVLAMSPAISLLRKGEELMPLMDTTGVTDRAPLMQAPGQNPKTEIRNSKEIRNSNSEETVAMVRHSSAPFRVWISNLIRISDFGLLSDFGFRISNFNP